MKIILSHDIDHLFWTEHFFDTYIPGQFRLSLRHGAKGLSRFAQRLRRNRLHNLYELNQFNETQGIRSHYFVATRKGLNLSYNYLKLETLGHWLIDEGNELGLHGQSPNDKRKLLEEKVRLESLFGNCLSGGIRNHYLRKNENTLKYMSEAGFTFDSTFYGTKAPFKHGNIWELPIALMDVWAVDPGRSEKENLAKSLTILYEYLTEDQPFFIINFHDIYYNQAFPFYKNWYESLVLECKRLGLEFITFTKAVKTLNKINDNLHDTNDNL